MTMKWFGESWGAPMCKDCPHVEVPVGETCVHCEEPIAAGDSGVIASNGPVFHRNCFLRGIYGSVAHVVGDCSCFVPGSTCGDSPGLTPRQAADEAVHTFELLRDLKKIL